MSDEFEYSYRFLLAFLFMRSLDFRSNKREVFYGGNGTFTMIIVMTHELI